MDIRVSKVGNSHEDLEQAKVRELSDLPDEIWLKIFTEFKDNLPQLKCLRKVSLRFCLITLDHSLNREIIARKVIENFSQPEGFWGKLYCMFFVDVECRRKSKAFLESKVSKQVTKLDISSQKISDEQIELIIESFPNLEEFNLLPTDRITTSQIFKLPRLKNLKTLNISHIHFDTVVVKKIRSMQILRALNISSSSLGAEGAKGIAKMTNLRALDISYNSLGREGAKAIAKMTNLRVLRISANRIYGESAKAIAKMTNLKVLDISDNRIYYGGAEAIATMRYLKMLDISNNRNSSKAVKKLLLMFNLKTLLMFENNSSYKKFALMDPDISKFYT